MTTTTADLQPSGATRWWGRLVHRELDRYPDDGVRYAQLALVVVVTIVLYFENYVSSGVANQILSNLHMSFTFFVTMLALANLAGALASVAAGLADRFGRANLVVGGLLVSGVLMTFALPNATSRWTFAILTVIIGVVEGIILVATPALVRDFSPQVGRATAMGFWTMGPVLGSLVVSVIATLTLPAVNPDWQGQYQICGAVGLATFVIALVALRELSPNLRDQLMVSLRERTLIEARAKGIDVDAIERRPLQMLKLDVVASALGVSLLLLIYFTSVAFGVLYLSTTFGFSQSQANGITNWEWGVDAIMLVLVGLASDRLRVRKPFMLAGGIGTAVMIVIFLAQANRHPSFFLLAVLVSLLSVFLGLAYAPWMASFTETVEARNPALTATGLAIWGLIIRLVVFVSFMIIPHVVTSVTPLANYGPQIQALAKKYPAEYATATRDPALVTALAKTPTDPALLAKARQVYGPTYLSQLLALQKVQTQFAPLTEHGEAVAAAQARTGSEWQRWYWVCFGGAVAFLPLMLLMRGRWSPAKARADAEAHDAEVKKAMAALAAGE